MPKIHNRFNYLLPFFLVVIFIILLRNFKALSVPSLYAEDAMWISKIIFNGFFDTALHAREGFPVFNLALLDYLSLVANRILFNSFLDLPYSILIISTFFYASVVAMPFFILRQGYTYLDKIFLSLFALFIPIGYSGSEVFGKVGNLVFLFPVLSIFLILSYKFNKSSLNFYFVSALLFFNSITFPVCLLILVFFIPYFIFIDSSEPFFKKNSNLINFHKHLKTIYLIFLTLFALYLYPTDFLSYKGGAAQPVNVNGLIDMGLCRMILYPFIVSFYGIMNDQLSILIFLFVLFFTARNIANKNIIIFLKSDAFIFFSGFSIFFLSTIVMRAGFSSWFGGYNNTFPDRYFYAINILFVQFLYILFKDNNYVRKTLVLIFFANVIIFSSKIIEINKTHYNFEKYGSFKQMFCDMEKNKIPEFIVQNHGNIDIPIYPVDHQFIWKFTIPLQDYNAMKLQCIS